MKIDSDKRIDFEKLRKFDHERTNIFISILFETFFVIIPFLVIWICIGPFWNLSVNEASRFKNYYDNLPAREVILIFITFLTILFVVLLNFISYYLKLQKEDSFTFTLAISLMFFSFIVNDIWIFKVSMSFIWPVRLALMFIFAFFGILIGVFITTFLRNRRFLIEEEDEKFFIENYNKKNLTQQELKRLEKANKFHNDIIEKNNRYELMIMQFDNKYETFVSNKKLKKMNEKEKKLRNKKNKK
ncbi:hypothetical protein EELLY_v1c07620 [Entomoplasma ellychniae]|uniref:Uncharacterized protein n=2 Tax=Entomoplasmataceae TaxID=33925 RepID=A0A2S5RGP4_9MOLU|nr:MULTISPECIES: hypothetical protein [Entomoplasmataceae]PPE05074.1 hypothetical protein EELLY_v1c07620 [Entomoplasma ellychniae]PPE06392.1 hypothetical protein MCORR_v1c00200 [Mesoplasma corruscae]